MKLRERHLIKKALKVSFGLFAIGIVVLMVLGFVQSYINSKKMSTEVVENNIIKTITGKAGEPKVVVETPVYTTQGMNEAQVKSLIKGLVDENNENIAKALETVDRDQSRIIERSEYITIQEVEDPAAMETINQAYKKIQDLYDDYIGLKGNLESTEDQLSGDMDQADKSIRDELEKKADELKAAMDSGIENANRSLAEKEQVINEKLTALTEIINNDFKVFKEEVNTSIISINEVIEDLNASKIKYNSEASSIEADNVQDAIDELGKYVANGKRKIATAISGQGVACDAKADWDTLVDSIERIKSEGQGTDTKTINMKIAGVEELSVESVYGFEYTAVEDEEYILYSMGAAPMSGSASDSRYDESSPHRWHDPCFNSSVPGGTIIKDCYVKLDDRVIRGGEGIELGSHTYTESRRKGDWGKGRKYLYTWTCRVQFDGFAYSGLCKLTKGQTIKLVNQCGFASCYLSVFRVY